MHSMAIMRACDFLQVNPYFMRQECSASCQVCSKLPFKQRPWRGWADEWATRFYAMRQADDAWPAPLAPVQPTMYLAWEGLPAAPDSTPEHSQGISEEHDNKKSEAQGASMPCRLGSNVRAQSHYRFDSSMGAPLGPNHTHRGPPWLTLSSIGIGQRAAA